jgi:DNA-binding transcriptional regulator YhcF (GntR family)
LKPTLDNNRPIFQQIREMIEEDILAGRLKPDEQIPSNSRLVGYYGVNPVTVHKGVTLLADEGLIYKKRGLGMFVAQDAPAILRKRHGAAFKNDYAEPFVRQARALGMSDAEIHACIDEALGMSDVEIHAGIDEALKKAPEEPANGAPANPKKEDDKNE